LQSWIVPFLFLRTGQMPGANRHWRVTAQMSGHKLLLPQIVPAKKLGLRDNSTFNTVDRRPAGRHLQTRAEFHR